MYELDYRMKGTTRLALAAGSACMVLGILFEAYASRMLQSDLLYLFEVGVKSQFYHGLGLILLGLLCKVLPYNAAFRWSTLLILSGAILFSGGLYLMALTDTKVLGLITPVGGLLLTVGWLTFTIGTLKKPAA
jgi:uncharacterized membrane protein YgdD (TMEM256/DUF423 family)